MPAITDLPTWALGLIGLAFALWGGWASRMTGGGWPSLPRPVDLALWALPFGALTFALGFPWWAAVLVAGGAFWTKSLSHTGLDMGRVNGLNPHKKVWTWLWSYFNWSWWKYDAATMATNGLILGLPFALIAGLTGAVVEAVTFAVLVAIAKPAAYELGWQIGYRGPNGLYEPTEKGEFVFGLLVYTLAFGVTLCLHAQA
jgi:hypothetical protein